MLDYQVTRKRYYIPSSNIKLDHIGINWVNNMIRDTQLTYFRYWRCLLAIIWALRAV